MGIAAVPPGQLELTVAAVMETMMGLDTTPVDGIDWSPGEDRVTAAVHLAGSWTGALVLETGHELARSLAGRFLGIDPPSQMNDDVRDALGEIVNMIGGNLKSALCPGASLSMPSVVDGAHYSLRIGNGEIQDRRAFSTAAGVFWVFRIAGAGRRPTQGKA